MGALTEGWYTGATVSETLGGKETLFKPPGVLGLSSTLLCTGTEGFLFARARVPLRHLPFGISAMASLVKLGVFLTLP